MIRALGVAVLAILTLSACAPINDMIERWFPPQAATAAQPGPQSGAQPGPQPGAQPAAGPATVPAAGAAEAPPLPRRKPETISEVAPAGADPQRLVGLDFDATKALLGDPAARMEQPPAKVWAYAGGSCTFSVFFFPSVDDQVFRVLAVEVTDGAMTASAEVMDQDDPVVRRCFSDLLQSQQTPQAG